MKSLLKSAESLFQESKNNTSLLANASSFIMHSIKDLNWVGFYLFENEYLIVGPFQGKPACVEIQVGNGVCGKAFQVNYPPLNRSGGFLSKPMYPPVTQ